MDVIAAIRRRYGLDIDPGNNDSAGAIAFLRDGLERACDSIAKDMYSEVTHFILELVQNADDNSYPEGVTPTLVLESTGAVLSVRCNEVGFDDDDVRALCAIRRSTKKDPSRYIGAKGIGFKSVFTVAETVSIFSGRFSFMLDRHKTLGMISPIWIDERHSDEGWSNIELNLSANTTQRSITLYLQSLQPSILLFLRKLHTIEIWKKGEIRRLTKMLSSDGVTCLSQSFNSGIPTYSNYLVIEHTTRTLPNEKDRQGILTSEIVLAFPLTSSGEPAECDQQVYAFLPVRSYGFRFIIQADFLTTTNREDIILSKNWNRTLCSAIPTAFMKAIPAFHARPALTYTWIRFLQHGNHANTFRKTYVELMRQIKKTRVLLSREKVLHCPMDLLLLPPEFKTSLDGEPLVSDSHFGGKHYLSAEYDDTRDIMLLVEMGVTLMTVDDFMKGLVSMQASGSLYTQSDDWWQKTCIVLLSHFARVGPTLRTLRMVPLADESWVTPAADSLFFDSTLLDVPEGLNFRLVAPLDPCSNRYRLLQDLGVKNVDRIDVARKIIALHRFNPRSLSPAVLPSHAHYLFRNRDALVRCPLTGLQVVTRGGNIVNASDAYMDHHSFMAPSLSTCLSPSQSPFLHPMYIEIQSAYPEEFKAWEDWLCDVLHVNIFPKFNEHDGLSPEFQRLVLSGDTRRLLLLLREIAVDFMPQLRACPRALHQLCNAPVTTSLGVEQPLKLTYIARGDLAVADFDHLPFLPIDNPDNSSWNFLAELGVSFVIDNSHYLKELIRLGKQPLDQESSSGDDEMLQRVKRCYKQLQSRTHIDNMAENILRAFQEYPLIYLPKNSSQGMRWIRVDSNVFWDGPPSIKSKIVLKNTYDDFEIFFSQQLCVPNAPSDILLRELEHTCELHPYHIIDEATNIHIHHIFKDIADTLMTSGAETCSWLFELGKFPCVPVETKPGLIELQYPEDGIYLPDVNGELARLFKGVIGIVTQPFPASAHHLTLLYKLFSYRPLDVVRPLQAAVQRKLLSAGHGHLSQSLTDKYRSRSHYLDHVTLTSPDMSIVQEFLRLLSNIRVFSIPGNSVTYKYTVDGISRIQTRFAGVEKDGDTLVVMIAKQCPSAKRDLYICRELSLLFPTAPISAETLLTIFSLSADILDELYSFSDGLGQLDDLLSVPGPEDNHSLQNPTIFERSAPSLPNNLVSPQASSPSPRIQPFHAIYKEQTSSLKQSRSISPAQSLPRRYELPRVDVDIVPSSLLKTFVISSLSTDVNTTRPRTPITPRQSWVGYEGERLVYEYLRDYLSGFSKANWSSELRIKMGLPPLVAPSPADFHYKDEFGILTRQFFGDRSWNAWRTSPPTYWIEVKSTAGAPDEPFHFSVSQISTAMRIGNSMGADVAAPPPTNIYVLARVSYVQSQNSKPCIQWYPNPWQMLCEGQMMYTSDVWLQIPQSEPDQGAVRA